MEDRPGVAATTGPRTLSDRIIDVMFWVILAIQMWVYFVQFRLAPFGFQIWNSWDPAGSAYTAAHVGAAGVMVCVWFLARKKATLPTWIAAIVFMAAFSLAGYYFMQNGYELLFRPSYGTAADLFIGLAMVFAVYYLSWVYWGPVFPILGLIFMAYMFVADLLPGPLKGPALDTQQILTRVVQKSVTDIVVLAARFLWMLVFWGLMMGAVGGGVSLLALARSMSKGVAGGPALGSVFSSAVTGSFVGAGASNVAITGPVTIPAMMKAGYTPEEAGSVEAMASNASSITPPILGAVAFIMSDLLGVSYIEIIVMSIIPAMLWFLAVGTWIFSHAKHNRHRIKAIQPEAGEKANISLYVRSALIIVVPVGSIVGLVIQGYTLRWATMIAFVLTVLLALVLRVETRRSAWVAALRNSAFYASSLTVIIVIVALIADALTFTGLGGRLGNVVEAVSGGHLIIAATIMIFVGVILGGPLPALPVYFIMIVTFAPVLQRMGVDYRATHYVAFYMGSLGTITLPVAASCLVAAAIAQTKYWPTAVVTAKVSWPLWIYPLLFVLAPELLLLSGQEGVTAFDTVRSVTAAVVVLVGVQCATGGWLIRDLRMPERTILFASFPLLVIAMTPKDDLIVLEIVAVGAVIGMAVLAFLTRGKRAPQAAVEAAPRAQQQVPPAG